MAVAKREIQGRKAKTKTAAAKAKAAANVAAAAKRLERLQTEQRICNTLRKQGHLGTTQQLLAIWSQQERDAEAVKARSFVETALTGPHGERVSRFLGDRVRGCPTRIAGIVRNYLQTQGVAC